MLPNCSLSDARLDPRSLLKETWQLVLQANNYQRYSGHPDNTAGFDPCTNSPSSKRFAEPQRYRYKNFGNCENASIR
jgi:hypothetical protein